MDADLLKALEDLPVAKASKATKSTKPKRQPATFVKSQKAPKRSASAPHPQTTSEDDLQRELDARFLQLQQNDTGSAELHRKAKLFDRLKALLTRQIRSEAEYNRIEGEVLAIVGATKGNSDQRDD